VTVLLARPCVNRFFLGTHFVRDTRHVDKRSAQGVQLFVVSALSDRLRAQRRSLGLSAAELAERVGVSQQSWSDWENGVVAPRPRRLAEVAQALSLDVAELQALYFAEDSPLTDRLAQIEERLARLEREAGQ
jgi:DNA-binding XRE family transcriptional regulator